MTGKITEALVPQRHAQVLNQRTMPCSHCQQGFAPLYDALQLSERRTPWDMKPAAARLAAEVPFTTAQELFMQLSGLSLSDSTIDEVAGELSQELGVLEVSSTAAEMVQRVVEMAAGKTWRPAMIPAIDRAFVPTRQDQTKGPPTGHRRTWAWRAGWQGRCVDSRDAG